MIRRPPRSTLDRSSAASDVYKRHILRREGYKPSISADQWQIELREELSDVFVFLFKLAYQCGVDVEDALQAGMVKADARYPLETGAPELARYLAQQTRPGS